MKKESVGYFVKPFVTTTLKKKHINELKDKIKEVISHAKTINADYEEVKSMRELLDNYLDSFDSPQ